MATVGTVFAFTALSGEFLAELTVYFAAPLRELDPDLGPGCVVEHGQPPESYLVTKVMLYEFRGEQVDLVVHQRQPTMH